MSIYIDTSTLVYYVYVCQLICGLSQNVSTINHKLLVYYLQATKLHKCLLTPKCSDYSIHFLSPGYFL